MCTRRGCLCACRRVLLHNYIVAVCVHGGGGNTLPPLLLLVMVVVRDEASTNVMHGGVCLCVCARLHEKEQANTAC